MSEKIRMVCEKNLCTGCMACLDICPKRIIKIEDSFSEYNAIIDDNNCIKCDSCKKVCQNCNFVKPNKPILWKQGWTKDSKIREKSSSGGLATEIARSFIDMGGVVFGCSFINGKFQFDMVNSIDNVSKLSGSKYVKSDPKGVYRKVIAELKKNSKVLFIGLPCQVAAVKLFVSPSLQDNLYTIDLICHGTPSPQLLDIFLNQYNIKLDDLSDIQFRSKNKFQLKGNEKYVGSKGIKDYYSIGFLNSLFYTENCYNCQYAKLERISDITLGDSWGTELPQAEKNHGISLILCQTQKGKNLLKISNLELYDVDLSVAIKYNHQLEHPSIKPPMHDAFFKALRSGKNFNAMIKKCFPKQCLKQFIKGLLIKIKLYDVLRGGSEL